MTSPYKFYQFLVNVDDADAGRYLRYFTLLDQPEIEALDQATRRASGEARGAARARAGSDAHACTASNALARSPGSVGVAVREADPTSLSLDALHALQLEIPVFTRRSEGRAARTYDVLEAACVGPDALFKSKGDMRRMIQQGGVYLNGKRATAEREVLSKSDFLAGEFVLIRKGRAVVRVGEGEVLGRARARSRGRLPDPFSD